MDFQRFKLIFRFLILISVISTVFCDRSSQSETNESDDDDYWSWFSSEELDCPDDQFFHIRGGRCVPYICPGGNSRRDHDTGECLPYEGSNEVGAAATSDVAGAGAPEVPGIKGVVVPAGEEHGIASTGWPIGNMGFYQPRGMSIDPMYKMSNGKRGELRQFGGGIKRRLQQNRHSLRGR